MDTLGADTMAWLGWLAGLPGGIATKAKNMDASAWASWVQAIGSIVAIVAGFGTVVYQNRHTDKSQEAQRRRRAEVVAYRLSGWIGEIGGRIERALRTCQERQSKASQGPPRVASDVIPEIRLGMVSGIDEVLPELHYLSSGSGESGRGRPPGGLPPLSRNRFLRGIGFCGSRSPVSAISRSFVAPRDDAQITWGEREERACIGPRTAHYGPSGAGVAHQNDPRPALKQVALPKDLARRV